MATKTVVIVDDNDVVRKGLALCLKERTDVQIVGEAADGYTAINMVRRLNPNIVLMDVRMKGIDGIATTRQIKTEQPNVKVLMLSGYDSDDEVLAAFGAGADGYCLKGAPPQKLMTAIMAVGDGVGWIDPPLARTVFAYAADAYLQANETHGKHSEKVRNTSLVLEELDVLAHLSKDYSNEEIARVLNIDSETVDTHVKKIMQKLEVADRTQAALRLFRQSVAY